MRKPSRILKICSVLFLVRILVAQQPQPASVEGIVAKQGSNDPLPKATIELRHANGNTTGITITTDEGGRFLLSKIEPGDYRLFASRRGYITSEYGQRQIGGPGQIVTLRSGQRAGGIQIAMTPGGVIAGRVLDRGEPSGNTQVAVVKVSYKLGQRVSEAVAAARTNDRGEYRVFWLPPGRYYVWAGVLDFDVDASLGQLFRNPVSAVLPRARYVFSTRSLHPGTASTERHVLTYFGDTPDLRDATPIDLAPGEEVNGVDIQANAVPSLHVRGSVSGIPAAPTGKTIPARVSLLPADTSNSIILPIVQTDANGDFEMGDVSPGAYIVYATAGNLQSRVAIDVRDRDVNGVKLTLTSGLNVSGRVIVESPTGVVRQDAVNALGVGLLADPVLGGFSFPIGARASLAGPVTPSPDGAFSIPNSSGPAAGPLPGNYRVYVGPLLTPPAGFSVPRTGLRQELVPTSVPESLKGAYVKSIRLGDTDVLNDGLHLEESPHDPLIIVIGTNPGAVDGRVLDSQQKPVSSATVVIIPENGLKFHINHRFTATDSSGAFQIKDIAPGDYRIFAWEYAERGAWQDPDFIRKNESRGQLIHISEGDETTVSLTSIP